MEKDVAVNKKVVNLKGNELKNKFGKFARNWQLSLLALPVVLYYFVFHYLPIGGIVLAFKDYRADKGIFGSDWVWFDNFKFFFESSVAARVTINTILYSVVLLVLGIILNIIIAMLLNELRNKTSIKLYQTAMFFPHFLSWVVVAFAVYTFISPGYGIITSLGKSMGMADKNWFMTPEVWPSILVFSSLWKSTGSGVLINYAILVGIDKSYYESAAIDGASRLQMAFRISLPFLIPVTMIQLILQVGGIFNADFGLFYQVPQNSPLLYKVTDVIETYVFRALMQMGNISMGAAVDLYKSFVGLILVLLTNKVVKKFREEDALF